MTQSLPAHRYHGVGSEWLEWHDAVRKAVAERRLAAIEPNLRNGDPPPVSGSPSLDRSSERRDRSKHDG